MPLSSTGSEWFEPAVTVPPEADVEAVFGVPHAARKAAAAAALPPSLSSSRRDKLLPRVGTGMPTSLGDGERREGGVSLMGPFLLSNLFQGKWSELLHLSWTPKS